MRNLARYSILLVVTAICLCSCKDKVPIYSVRFRDDHRNVTFSIPELGGPECSKELLHVLNQHNGVLNAAPDLIHRTIVVMYNSRTTAIKNIEHAIAGKGFDVDDTKGNTEAKSKLPPDCH